MYNKLQWKDSPSEETPITAENLNRIEDGILLIETKVNLNAGLKTQTLTVTPSSGTSVVAEIGSEIFNDYNERTFDSNGRAAQGNVASGAYSHAEGQSTTASGLQSHAEGYRTIAGSNQTHAEGYACEATGMHSHAEGYVCEATGTCSHAEGNITHATGGASHAEGNQSIASGNYSHAEGDRTQAVGICSHSSGCGTFSRNFQFVCGKYNAENYSTPASESDVSGTIFIVGGGTAGSDRRTALRTTTDGKTYGLQSFSGSGADFAEMFEIEGGNPNNEDYRGYFVTTNENGKIRKATTEDNYILGVVSSTPTICGDVQSEMWQGQFLTDVFGEKIVEVIEVEETTDEFGNVVPAHTEKKWILNPKYDPNQEYISREDRQEWVAVGLIGKLIVIDDGTCTVGGYCKVAEQGTATQADNGWKVLKRVDDTHIQILYR